MANEKVVKKYVCAICNYSTLKKVDYNKHMLTLKHKKSINNNNNGDNKKIYEKLMFVCDCGKSYKHHSSLCYHKKKCAYIKTENEKIEKEELEPEEKEEIEETEETEETEKEGINYKELVMNLLNDNKELRNILLEQNSKIIEIIPKIGNTNNTINNKQRFNINVFLNETCKDALNMSDFIKSIEVSLEQLDFTKANGLEKGITKVIMDNINNLSVDKRPIHCTDIKRDTLYVKEDDKWEKDKDKAIVKKAINDISNKNYHTVRDWMDDNPDYSKIDEKQDFFARTISALGKPLGTVDDKIIKRLSTNTYIKDLKDEQN